MEKAGGSEDKDGSVAGSPGRWACVALHHRFTLHLTRLRAVFPLLCCRGPHAPRRLILKSPAPAPQGFDGLPNLNKLSNISFSSF